MNTKEIEKRADYITQKVYDKLREKDCFEGFDEWKLIVVGSKHTPKVKIQTFEEE